MSEENNIKVWQEYEVEIETMKDLFEKGFYIFPKYLPEFIINQELSLSELRIMLFIVQKIG